MSPVFTNRQMCHEGHASKGKTVDCEPTASCHTQDCESCVTYSVPRAWIQRQVHASRIIIRARIQNSATNKGENQDAKETHVDTSSAFSIFSIRAARSEHMNFLFVKLPVRFLFQRVDAVTTEVQVRVHLQQPGNL